MKKRKFKKLKISRKNKILLFMVLIFSVTALFSLFMIVSTMIRNHREKEAFEQIALIVEQEKAKTDIDKEGNEQLFVEDESSNVSEENISPYGKLYEMNNDFFGWIKIEDTPINYPVMHTPEDSEYYLRRAFDKSDSQSGTPFMDASSYEGCGNYIIYAHHMKNGTMFASLQKYADKDYWESHRIINFDTINENARYEIIAVFYSDAILDNDSFKYYKYADLTEPKVFEEYMEGIQKAALYDTGLTAIYGDELITLSTCSYHTEDGRFAVVAKKIKE